MGQIGAYPQLACNVGHCCWLDTTTILLSGQLRRRWFVTLTPSQQRERQPDPKLFNIQRIETLPVTATQLKTATNRDTILSKVLRYTKHGWPTEVPDRPYWYRRSELSIEDDCILWGMRVVVPLKLREAVLAVLHRSHIGIVRMKMIARSYVWWPKLYAAIERMVKSCIPCQETKNAPAVALLHPWIWPVQPWQQIHIDFAGPMNGQNFLIVVDSHSKWLEVIEQQPQSKNSEDCLQLMGCRNI